MQAGITQDSTTNKLILLFVFDKMETALTESTILDLCCYKNNWIDFNCGTLAEGGTLTELRDRFFDYIISVASGEQVKSEKAGFHDMAIFKQGVTL